MHLAIRTSIAMAVVASASLASGTVSDDGQTVDATNLAAPHTYNVKNNGLDNNITAVAKNSSGETVAWISIGNGSSHDIGVPQGGSLVIDDRAYSGSQTDPTITNDTDTNGAGYTTKTID